MTPTDTSLTGRLSSFGIDIHMLAVVLGSTLILMMPALLNGAPFIFLDTQHYFLVGQRIVETLIGAGDVVVEPVSSMAAAPAVSNAPAQAVEQGGLAALAGGRSPIYAVFIYVLSTTVGVWVAAALQALICAILIVRFGMMIWGRSVVLPLISVAVLAIVSSLGFHATFMMPDVFAGCMVLALAIFLFAPGLGRIEAIFLVLAAFVFATMHTSNVLVVVSALIAVVIIRLVERAPLKPLLQKLGVVAGVAVAAVVFAATYTTAVKVVSGDEVRSFPYLTARVLGDETGERYLASHCSGEEKPFAACIYAGMDFLSQDDFLSEPSSGGYQVADAATKVELSNQDVRFALAVAASDPLGQAVASLGNFARAVTSPGIDEVSYGLNAFADLPDWHNSEVLPFIPGGVKCIQDKQTCAPKAWTEVWRWEVSVIGIASLVVFAALAIWFAIDGRKNLSAASAMAVPLVRAAFFLALLVLANAAICGVLSGVHDRYQGRVSWTLFLALVAFLPVIRPWLAARSSR